LSDERVALAPATPADAPLLENLLHLYVHDLSAYFPLRPGPDGRFRYDRLPLYFTETDTRWPFLIRVGDRVAGFALATRGSPVSDDPEVLDVAEFFVLRGERRGGVGRRAAQLLWSRLPGRWIVRVLTTNAPALPFWESAIREHTGGAFEARDHAAEDRTWRVFEFESGGAARSALRAPDAAVDRSDFAAFFARYAAAFDASDAEAIASFYHLPCLVVRSGSVVAFRTADALLANLRALLESYTAQGYERACFVQPAICFLDRDLALVTVPLTIERGAREPQSFRNTYELARLDGRWGIVVSTQHAGDGPTSR
jgi:predicted acetyltransferase